MIVIKNIYQRLECHSAQQVLDMLSQYRGKSVTLAYVLPSGIERVVFVDVNQDGTAVDSYKDIQIDLVYLTNIFHLELNIEV
ncbi:hypothetical protein ACRWQL_00895 (plasmid) [Shewanella sp. HL-SH4]|uniref:hypothetical protein n=1 Tax=Shewanella TaxID=22 RepID=UPI003D7B775B